MSAKRANVFSQGRPENPYEDRDGPPDPPMRATAAQMASRKIKSIKPRRTGASPSPGMSQNASFGGAPSGFGAPIPTESGASSFAGFGEASSSGNNAFGGDAANSFPPAQPSASTNTFSNSSFAGFGASTQGTRFNPQPPASNSFNFTAAGGNSNSNPFGASAPAPATNGDTPAPVFGAGSSLFSQQPSSSSFGGLAQNNTSSTQPPSSAFGALAQNNTSSAPSGNMFGPTSNVPQSNMFSTTSAAPNDKSAPAPASTPFSFSSNPPSAPSSSTPATNSLFSGFGAPTQTAPPATSSMFSGSTQSAPPAQNNMFNFGSKTPSNEAPSQPAQNNALGSISTSAEGSKGFATTAPAHAPSLFNTTLPTSTSSVSAPTNAPSLFNTTLPTSTSSVNSPTFFGTTAGPSPYASAKGMFNFNPSAPKNETPAPNLFTASSVATENISTPAPAPAGDAFGNLGPESGPETTQPASTPSGFSIFGAASKTNDSSDELPKLSGASRSGLFNPFSTPQATKIDRVEKPAFHTVQRDPPTSLFSKPLVPPSTPSMMNANAFKLPPKYPSTESSKEASKESGPFGKQSTAASEGRNLFSVPKEAQTISKESSPFSQQSTATSEARNLFNAPKEAPAASPAPPMLASSDPQADALKAPEIPKVPKVHVPKGWPQPGSVAARGANGAYQHMSDLTAQLQALNDKYRQQLSTLPLTADWSAISLWHYQHASDIKKKIDNAKKQRAAANGITGTESALSTKRKVQEDSHENWDPSPSKRVRGSDAPATPTPQPAAPTQSLQPTSTSTSNMFAKAINGTKSLSAPSAGSGLFAPKMVEKAPVEPSESTPAASNFPPSNSASAAPSSSDLKPSFGSAPTGSFKFTLGSSSGGSSFMSQFKKVAKSYEELAAERKAKAKEEDFDEDEETEEEWSARYDKEEAERVAEEKRQVAENSTTFSVVGSTTSSRSTTPATANPSTGSKKPAVMTSAPASGVFTPRAYSPALSTGSQTVLDTISHEPSPSNIFGHLSSAPSSNHQDDSDGDDGVPRPVGSVEPTTPPKRKSGGSETEDESLEETMRSKSQEAGVSSKGSLFSRMSRAGTNDADSEKGTSSTYVFGQSNGAQTPTNKPFSFFDFGAASSRSSSPKPESFAGDQTFKPGSPIKFGDAPVTDKKASGSLFQFQPATPAPGEFSTTPAKTVPTSLFNFAPSTGGSSLLAPNAGTFPSRAATPLSEAETNTSAAENDDDEEAIQAQVDFSQLTEGEKNTFDVLFHTEVALAKHQVDDGKQKAWANLAKGPIWILKDKATAKCVVRIRLPNGSTPINYAILPSIRATVTGGSKKMVLASKPAKEGGLQSVLYAVKTPAIAEELASTYNQSLPSN